LVCVHWLVAEEFMNKVDDNPGAGRGDIEVCSNITHSASLFYPASQSVDFCKGW
jgi:hypothetical protein